MVVPDRLYKFRTLDKYASDLFCRGVMYFSTPGKLNDPFELGPILESSCTAASFRKAAYSELLDAHPEWSSQELAEAVDQRMQDDYPPSQDDLDATVNAYAERLGKVGVFCATARWDSIVMWSHYADAHGGFCVEFDPSALKEAGPQFHPVTYLRHRPRLNVFSDRDSANRVAALSKNEEWRYEDEWRLVLDAKPDKRFPLEVDVPDGLIVGLVLGARMSAEDRQRVLDWSKQVPGDIEITEAFLNEHEYTVGRRPVGS